MSEKPIYQPWPEETRRQWHEFARDWMRSEARAALSVVLRPVPRAWVKKPSMFRSYGRGIGRRL